MIIWILNFVVTLATTPPGVLSVINDNEEDVTAAAELELVFSFCSQLLLVSSMSPSVMRVIVSVVFI